ncbi:uncharacterized protein LOC133635730 [Entelurus aequoreus]|uniref:uncharacterized protein LOC133635730 n=1 Tax=Entelurus aequoreus TaxID=161455 RepID=UPI002B1D1D98|nr:uncharacterized protein LOC133635730 [Entelurus aequoreus]
MVESPSCTLCGKIANLEHVLSSCRSSLADFKFRWRHDQILAQLAGGVEQARKRTKQLSNRPRFIHFIRAAFAKFGVPAVTEGVKVVDSSGTEIDDDVFEEIVKDPPTGVLTIKYETESVSMVTSPKSQPSVCSSDSDTIILEDTPTRKRQRLDSEAMQLVKSILTKKSGGKYIINEYNQTKSLTDESRRKLVNILAAEMTENNGTSPSRQVKEMYAQGIVNLFPNLRDPFSKNGYQQWYWVLGLENYFGGRPSEKDKSGGPTVGRVTQFIPEIVLSEDECKEAMSLMKHSADVDMVIKKMKLTFAHRHNMVLDQQQSSNIQSYFPRFKDIKGLVEQDFVLMFGEDVSGKFLEKWPTAFKKKIIQQCRKLPSITELEELLMAADPPEDGAEVNVDFGWDSDLSSILLLLHLIPPTALGRKRPGKVSASRAEKHLVVFKKILLSIGTGTSIQEHLDTISTSTQPYLLAVGVRKNTTHQFFIILDKNAIPCRSHSSLGAFDELFKAHFVFVTSYHTMLHNMYTFIQTTLYNIDVGKVKESPRVAEIRTTLLL